MLTSNYSSFYLFNMEWLCPASILYTGIQSYTAFHVLSSPEKIREPRSAPVESDVDNVEEIVNSRKKIIESVLSLYKFQYTQDTFDVLADDVTFEDPAIYFKGKDSLKNGLNLIKTFIKSSETVQVKEHHFEHEIRMDLTQKYTTILAIPVTITSALYLKLEGEQGQEKIVAIIEEWGRKCLLNGQNTPFLATGNMATMYRKFHGKLCSFFPRLNMCFNSKVGHGEETYEEIK